MAYQQSDLLHVENIGSVDRVNRVIAGVSLIMVAVLFTALPEASIVGFVAAGAYLGLTAFIGWDPVYATAKAVQHQTPAQISATVVSHQRHDSQAHTDEFKKAA